MGVDAVLLGAWANHPNPQTILDIGTGSGVIALQLAQRFPLASITAVEIDEAASRQAEENFKASRFGERIQIVEGDILSTEPHPKTMNVLASPAPSPQAERGSLTRPSPLATRHYDLVVCNPPYFDEPHLAPNEQRATARHATVSLPFNLLLKRVAELLADNGNFCCVLTYTKCKAFIKEAEQNHLKLNRLTNIKHTIEKPYSICLMQFSKQDIAVQIEELVLYGEDGERTEEYHTLTKDFYL